MQITMLQLLLFDHAEIVVAPHSLIPHQKLSTKHGVFLAVTDFWCSFVFLLNFKCFKHTLAQTGLSTGLDTAWSEGLDGETEAFTSGVSSCSTAEQISNIME